MKKKPVIFFLLFIAIFLLSIPVSAQDSLNVRIRRSNAVPFSDKIGYTVNLYVSVLDSSGKPVRGLDMDHFKVYEDSLPQTLTEARSAEDEPLSIALVMDMSGSMLGQALYDPQSISEFLHLLSGTDRSAVISYNERISILQRFTSDHASSISAASGAKPENGRGSCLYDALYEGLELSLSQTAGRRAVVIFTDGKDELADGSICSTRPLSDVLNFSAENRIPVFTIGIGENTDDKELQRIAETTGGSFTKITPTLDMNTVFGLIYAQLSHEYKITYKTERNAGEHAVLVESEKDSAFGKNSAVVTLPVMPTIMRFQSPEEGSQQQGEVLLSVAFITQSSEVANVEYFCNGQQLGKVISYPYTFSWDLAQWEPGVAMVEAIAYNRENQELARASRMIFIQETAAAEPTQELPTAEPTTAPTATALPVKEEKSGTSPILFVCLGGLAAAVIILVILLSKKKDKPKNAEPVYIPPLNYSAFSDPAPKASVSGLHIMGSSTASDTLQVIHSDDPAMPGKRFSVKFLPFTLGRSADNNAVFTELDRAVGRHHAVLEEWNGLTAIRDLNSRYGTYVNEQKAGTDPVILNNGDAIRLGSRLTLKFTKAASVSGSQAEATAIIDTSSLSGEETMISNTIPEEKGEKTVRVVLLGKNKRK